MRDDFSKSTKDTLARRVNYCCSNPKCRKPTSGPHTNANKTMNIGVAAHLTAASEGAARYDTSLSNKQRRSIENGIWLCQSCAKLIDNDSKYYTLEKLQGWKNMVESITKQNLENNEIPNSINNSPFHTPIPEIYGLPYSKARQLLIQSGWQPFMNQWSYANDVNIRHGNGMVFWEKGYHEIDSTSGTGYGFCRFEFVDAYNNRLKVITAGEEIPVENIKAIVVRWFFVS
jgi:hypothetical protein